MSLITVSRISLPTLYLYAFRCIFSFFYLVTESQIHTYMIQAHFRHCFIQGIFSSLAYYFLARATFFALFRWLLRTSTFLRRATTRRGFIDADIALRCHNISSRCPSIHCWCSIFFSLLIIISWCHFLYTNIDFSRDYRAIYCTDVDTAFFRFLHFFDFLTLMARRKQTWASQIIFSFLFDISITADVYLSLSLISIFLSSPDYFRYFLHFFHFAFIFVFSFSLSLLNIFQ